MNNLETKKQRLAHLINSKIIDLPKGKFAEKIGISNTQLSFYLNDNVVDRPIKDTDLQKIYQCFPEINPQWLEKGEGEMLRHPNTSKATETRRESPVIPFSYANSGNDYSAHNPQPIQNTGKQQNYDTKTTAQPFIYETNVEQPTEKEKVVERKIKQILVLYDNGNYEEFSSVNL